MKHIVLLEEYNLTFKYVLNWDAGIRIIEQVFYIDESSTWLRRCYINGLTTTVWDGGLIFIWKLLFSHRTQTNCHDSNWRVVLKPKFLIRSPWKSSFVYVTSMWWVTQTHFNWFYLYHKSMKFQVVFNFFCL